MKTARDRRSGVALIITLGLLTILLLLAFSFAVSMQTEKTAAMAFADGAQARQAVFNGFTLAARRCVYDVGIYPNWSGATLPGRLIYNNKDQNTGRVKDLGQVVSNYIPGAIMADVLNEATNVFWCNTFYTYASGRGAVANAYTEAGTAANTTAVRVIQFEPIVCATLIANCSGLLDANIVGRSATNRAYGASGEEIRCVNLPDYKGTMITTASSNTPMESQSELNAKVWDYAYSRPGNNTYNQNFFHYSHFPVGQYWNRKKGNYPDGHKQAVTRSVSLYGCTTAADIQARKRDIVDAFSEAGFTEEREQAYLLTNLIDYVDADNQPGTGNEGIDPDLFARPCQEPIPMFNELRFQSEYTCTRRGGAETNIFDFTIRDFVSFELWNPFGICATYRIHPDLKVNSDISFSCTELQTVNSKFIAPIQNDAFNTVYPVASDTLTMFTEYTNLTVQVWNDPRLPQRMFTLDMSAYSAANPNDLIEIVYQLNFPYNHNDPSTPSTCLRDKDDKKIDSFAEAFSITVTNTLRKVDDSGPLSSLYEIPGGLTATGIRCTSLECLDPRLNWDIQATNQWRYIVPGAETMGHRNGWVDTYLDTNPADGLENDGDTVMYTANKPLQIIGELGNLVYAPWCTVRLYDPIGKTNYHAVLDTFTLYNTNATKAVRGLVNPNSEVRDVLAAVYDQMKVENYPGDPNPYILNFTTGVRPLNNLAAEPCQIAQRILDYTGISTNNFFMNVSDLGNVSNLWANTTFLNNTLRATNSLARESILRNSANLFNTRQQLYTMIVTASYAGNADANADEGSSAYLGSWANISSNTLIYDEFKNDSGFVNFKFKTDVDIGRGSERRAVVVFWRDSWTGEGFIRLFKFIDY